MDLLQLTPTNDSTLQTPKGDLYLKFDLDTPQQLAFPAMGVLEVVELARENVTTMPNVNPLLMGTFNLRGEILWILDLVLMFRETYLNPSTGQYAVIVVPDEDTSIGLAVPKIRGMTWLDTQQIQGAGTLPFERLKPYVRGSYMPEDRSSVLLLDPEALVQSRLWHE